MLLDRGYLRLIRGSLFYALYAAQQNKTKQNKTQLNVPTCPNEPHPQYRLSIKSVPASQ